MGSETMSQVDWIDLPDDNYVAVLGYDTPLTRELNERVKKYNSIPKDQVPTLSCRIRKLDQLLVFLKEWVDEKLSALDKKKHLLWIAEIAQKKLNYLNALLDIYEKGKHEQSYQVRYHCDVEELSDLHKKPVFLQNDRFFSLKMREYWGDFWYEALDPCHRRLTPFLDQWRSLQAENPQIPHFFLWLETLAIPKYVPRVNYLKDLELEARRVSIKDGLFWEKSDGEWSIANFADSTKRYLFSINLKGDLYVAEEANGISHSSFTCGKAVLGAGLLQVSEGKLQAVALESGHYLPTTEIGFQILTIFREKKALFPQMLELVFFHDRNKYKAEISQKELESLESFKQALEVAYKLSHRGCHESTNVAQSVH